MLIIYRLKKAIIDKEQRGTVEMETGNRSSWRNRSDQQRFRREISRRDATNRQQAARRQRNPELPYNPANPFDSYQACNTHMPSISSTLEDVESVSDCITVSSMPPPSPSIRSTNTGSAYAQHTSVIGRRRRRVDGGSGELAHVERMQIMNRENAELQNLRAENARLKVQVEAKRLAKENERLRRELDDD
jgi:hypothetical protein